MANEDKRKLDKAILSAFGIEEKIGETLLSSVYASIKAYFHSIKSTETKED